MLSFFCVKRTFYKLDVKLWVDCERHEATLSVKYDGILQRAHEDVAYADVMNPEKAEAWLGSPIHTRDGDVALIEWLEAHYKRQHKAA